MIRTLCVRARRCCTGPRRGWRGGHHQSRGYLKPQGFPGLAPVRKMRSSREAKPRAPDRVGRGTVTPPPWMESSESTQSAEAPAEAGEQLDSRPPGRERQSRSHNQPAGLLACLPATFQRVCAFACGGVRVQTCVFVCERERALWLVHSQGLD